MAMNRYPDASGDTIFLQEVDNFLFAPDLPLEAITGLSSFPFRQDDVLICSYPKSGCHWLWEITRMLLDGTTDVDATEKEDYMMEYQVQARFEEYRSPRVLNTHVLMHHLSPAYQVQKPKILLVLRNPKDVAVSFYHHHRKLSEYEYSGAFKNYLGLFVAGHVDSSSVFDYCRDWEKTVEENPDYPILELYYEDLKEDALSEVKRASQFLGKHYSDDFLQKVVDRCNFHSMRARKGDKWVSADGQSIMYRKGEVGDWKNWFTVAQSEAMDEVCRRRMAGSKYRFRYSLDTDRKGARGDSSPGAS